MNDIEKIKAKIKRLMKETDDSQFGIGGRCMCRIILDFIDSMSEEKPSEDSKEDILLLERAWLTLDGFGHEELAERLRKLKEKYANKM